MSEAQSASDAVRRDWSELSDEAIIEQEPTHARRLVYAVFVVLICLLLWSALASIDTVTRGIGKVIPSSQVQVIGSQDGGIVQEILVNEGDIVERGQDENRTSSLSSGCWST
mgnify:CR=1 FL=1